MLSQFSSLPSSQARAIQVRGMVIIDFGEAVAINMSLAHIDSCTAEDTLLNLYL